MSYYLHWEVLASAQGPSAERPGWTQPSGGQSSLGTLVLPLQLTCLYLDRCRHFLLSVGLVNDLFLAKT